MRFSFLSLARTAGASYVQRGAAQNSDSQLWIRNISFITGKEQLTDYFSKFGKIKSVALPTDRITGLHRGIAFMDFEDINDAKKLLDEAVHIIDERRVYVKASQNGPLSTEISGEGAMFKGYQSEEKSVVNQQEVPPSPVKKVAKNPDTQDFGWRKRAAHEVSGDNKDVDMPEPAKVEESSVLAANEATVTTEPEQEQVKVDDSTIHAANDPIASVERVQVKTKIEEPHVQVAKEPINTESGVPSDKAQVVDTLKPEESKN